MHLDLACPVIGASSQYFIDFFALILIRDQESFLQLSQIHLLEVAKCRLALRWTEVVDVALTVLVYARKSLELRHLPERLSVAFRLHFEFGGFNLAEAHTLELRCVVIANWGPLRHRVPPALRQLIYTVPFVAVVQFAVVDLYNALSFVSFEVMHRYVC